MTDINDVLAERKKTHGLFSDHAEITQDTKIYWRDQPGWKRLNKSQQETLDMIAHKVGRILAGDPNVADHWTDIAGYATLVYNQLTQEKVT